MQRFILTVLLFSLRITLTTASAQSIKAADEKAPVTIEKTAQAVTPATYKGRVLTVASGGGVTGFTTYYYLLDDGQLFGKQSRDNTFSFLAKQTPANTKRIFDVVEGSCKIKKTKFDNPGNMYKLVQWRKGGQAYRVAWGDPDKTVPANYPRFYDSFMSMIPASLRLK